MIVYLTSQLLDLELEWTLGEGKGYFLHSPTPSLFLTIDCPLGTNLFLSQPSTAIKIKDGGHNFCLENTEHLLAKLMSAL